MTDKPVEIDMSVLDEAGDDISDVRLLDIPVILLFVFLILIVAAQFFTRYVLNDSLGWTEEIARYCLIALGFTGAVICTRKQSHIRLEFFYRYLPQTLIKPLALLAQALTGFFWGYVGWLGFEMVARTKGQKMVTVALPKSLIHYVVIAACFLMLAYTIYHFIRLVRTPASELATLKSESI